MNILLVDDHALFRGGLKFLLQQLDTGLVLDEAGNCAQALEWAAGRHHDLVLLDLNMPGPSHLDALAALCEAEPEARVVVLSGETDPRIVRAAIDRGAAGFIPKAATPEVLVEALRLVLAGGVYLPLEVLAAMPEPAQAAPAAEASADAVAPSGLTPRQTDVLKWVIKGKSNKVIARALSLSEATVKVHVSSVLRAFGVQNRTEAVIVAAKRGYRLV